MAVARPSLQEVRLTIAENLYRDRLTIRDVAEHLHVSRSTLQRTLSAENTSFTTELQTLRLARALRHLTHDHYSAARTAAEVGLSVDHLCVVVKQATGLTTREIIRARTLGARAARLRRALPPRSKSAEYRRRHRAWRILERDLGRLLGKIKDPNPLAPWAQKVLSLRRPDFRKSARRRILQEHRRREQEALDERLSELLRYAARQRSGARR